MTRWKTSEADGKIGSAVDQDDDRSGRNFSNAPARRYLRWETSRMKSRLEHTLINRYQEE